MRVARVIVAVGTGLVLTVFWSFGSVRMTPPDPRSVDGISHVLLTAGISGVAGFVTARIARRDARAAGLTVAVLLAALGATAVLYAPRGFYEWVIFAVAPPCYALGVEVRRRLEHGGGDKGEAL